MAKTEVCLLMVLMVGQTWSQLVDIQPYYSLILDAHNQLRNSVHPPASDMREMMWDDFLEHEAARWASQCHYERPPRQDYEVGSNLFYQRKHVRSWHSVRTAIQKGLRTWTRGREQYQYGVDCGSSCSYVQMIYSSTYRVGCALNACPILDARDRRETNVTLLVCFYSPRGQLTSTYPYRSGVKCSECPMATYCSDGLCAEGSHTFVARPEAIQHPHRPGRIEIAPPSKPQPPVMRDSLSDEESRYILQLQNMMRAKEGCADLKWDPALKQWTDWIINCNIDYPGPNYAYTSFYRCSDHTPMFQVVYSWAAEGRDTSMKMDKGCRTPFDHTKCNHFTNMMQPSVNSVACSACNCGDGTRQLVCIYDNDVERDFRGY